MLNFLNCMTPLNENASVVVAISAKHEAGVCRPGGPPPPRRQSRGYGAPQGDFGERQYSERPAPEMRPGEQCSNSTCLPWSGTGDIGCSLYRQSPGTGTLGAFSCCRVSHLCVFHSIGGSRCHAQVTGCALTAVRTISQARLSAIAAATTGTGT